MRGVFPDLTELYDNTASLQDRTVTTGIVKPELAAQFGAGGYVGRASGRTFDARRALAYAPYDKLSFEVPVRDEGDVNARVWLRIREVEQSLSLIEQILGAVPAGAIKAPIGRAKCLRGPGSCEASAATFWCGSGSMEMAGLRVPFTRRVVVPMAAAGGGNRGKYRRRFPALQQVVQLLLLGARPIGRCAKSCSKKLDQGSLTELAAGVGRGRARRTREERQQVSNQARPVRQFARLMPAPATDVSWKFTR